MTKFGENLRIYREAHSLTQEELANMLHTSKQVISRYESGMRSPKISVAVQFAETLGVSLEDLTGSSAPQTQADAPSHPRPIADADIKFALFGGDGDITDEQFEEVKRYALYLKAREKYSFDHRAVDQTAETLTDEEHRILSAYRMADVNAQTYALDILESHRADGTSSIRAAIAESLRGNESEERRA